MAAPHLNPAHKGRLHAALHIPLGKPIPLSDLMKAKHSRSPNVRKEAAFAEVARGWSHSR